MKAVTNIPQRPLVSIVKPGRPLHEHVPLSLPGHMSPSGLLCLKTAKEGGLSSWASSYSAYNKMVKKYPDLAKVHGHAELVS